MCFETFDCNGWPEQMGRIVTRNGRGSDFNRTFDVLSIISMHNLAQQPRAPCDWLDLLAMIH